MCDIERRARDADEQMRALARHARELHQQQKLMWSLPSSSSPMQTDSMLTGASEEATQLHGRRYPSNKHKVVQLHKVAVNGSNDRSVSPM
jgi:hypothetical protein